MHITATPVNGARIRKENGALLKPEGETVERNSFWLRREADGDVTLSPLSPAPVVAEDAPAAVAPKAKK